MNNLKQLKKELGETKYKLAEIERKIIVILVAILWAIMLFITGIRLINWQNEYKNKDEQIKLLEQSLNEQLVEKEVYMKMLESGEKQNEQKK